jgi:putative transcriptional regulator
LQCAHTSFFTPRLSKGDMSKITIRTTADETVVDGPAAAYSGPQVSEPQASEQLLPGPERTPDEAPAREGRALERVRTRPVSRVKTVRRALGLTQEEFAARYGIPVGTLRDWEQGRTEPDQPARAYIRVIASNPEWVSQALAAEPQ